MQATSHTVCSDWYCTYCAISSQSAGRESSNMHGEIGYTECYCIRAQSTHYLTYRMTEQFHSANTWFTSFPWISVYKRK